VTPINNPKPQPNRAQRRFRAKIEKLANSVAEKEETLKLTSERLFERGLISQRQLSAYYQLQKELSEEVAAQEQARAAAQEAKRQEDAVKRERTSQEVAERRNKIGT
jgi:hypothetical protein